jgi:AcrR family transcriptional regulator
MPKVSPEYRDARRAHILAAANRCFVRDGFHATSMQDLFAEAGLSAGAVYRYFASKDELIVAIVEENVREVISAINVIATERRDEPLGAALADVIEVIARKHQENGTAALAVQVWSEVLRNEALADQLRTLTTEMRKDFAGMVREHQARGHLPSDVPAPAIASVLIALVPGYIMQLATLGPEAVRGVPRALRAMWP